MVRRCFLCKKQYEKGLNRSFRKFPNNLNVRKQWMEILDLADNTQINKSFICSDHFLPTHILKTGRGSAVLKVNAVPCKYNLCETEVTARSTTGTLVVMDFIEEPGTSEENIISQKEQPTHKDDASVSSSITLTASPSTSEKENQYSDVDIISHPPKRRKMSHPRYFGDCHSSDMSSPTKAKQNWQVAKRTVRHQKQQIRSLQRKNRRLKDKIVCQKSMLKYLRENNYINEMAESVVEASLPGDTVELMKRVLKGPSHQKYEPSLRCFALTLNFYSPKAYNFVREKFNKSLPHPSTISKWFQSVNGKPGFTKEALHALNMKVEEGNGKRIFANLVFDEMHIMKKIEWTGEKFTGYVDIGTNLDSDHIPEATEALVFMLVALNASWKIPVGYFLTNGFSGEEKANLITNCLIFLSEVAIQVTSITFDGAIANLSMIKHLGAKFDDVENLKTFFTHPVTTDNVYIFLDPSHMLKLVRNFLGSQKNIEDGDHGKIEWKYLENLVELQNAEGLQAATKLKRRHMNWVREKMKVKIAAQTLSRSVADALQFLEKDLKLQEFKGCESTSKFILTFNNLFDIFNSRNVFAKYEFKQALSSKNQYSVFSYLENTVLYIKGLTVNGQSVLRSSRKTGFLGFLINVASLRGMYKDFIEDTLLLKYLLTYKFSQDHLEIFFSAMRSRCGSNNNPTARMFEANYKRLLVHTEVKGGINANAVALDATTILYCSSSNITLSQSGEDLTQSTEYLRLENELCEHDYLSSSMWHLTDYVEDIITYIAGFVVRTVGKCISCKKCLQILESLNPISKSMLQQRKTYGKLKKASCFVILLCKTAEQCIRLLLVKNNKFMHIQKLKMVLVTSALQNLPLDTFDVFGDHRFECDVLNDHALIIARLIIEKYIDVRLHHEATKLQNSCNSVRVRSLLTKTIIFKNQ